MTHVSLWKQHSDTPNSSRLQIQGATVQWPLWDSMEKTWPSAVAGGAMIKQILPSPMPAASTFTIRLLHGKLPQLSDVGWLPPEAVVL